MSPGDRLGDRALGRATLARQMLLARAEVDVPTALGRLAGLNAQDAVEPYLMLWSRLASFVPEDLTARLHDRSVVRASAMRNTQHLLLAADHRAWRTPLGPALDRSRRGFFGRETADVDLAELAEAGRAALAVPGGLTRPELGRVLAQRWPRHDPVTLARSVQALLPVVHPPPASTWEKRGGATRFVLAGDWSGEPDPADAPDALVLAHLRAFGPASVRDVQAWSGLTGLAEVLDRLRPRLRRFVGDDGRELFDLPDAPRPDPDTPAPCRLLPLVDNLLVAHHDRARVLPDAHRRTVCVGAAVYATVLVDGAVVGLWEAPRRSPRDGPAPLTVRLLDPLGPAERDAVTAEARALLGFLHAGHEAAVEIVGP